MSYLNLVRWGGIAAVVAGLVFIVLVLLGSQGSVGVSFLPGPLSTVLFIVALLGQMAGIAGLHALQRRRYGRLGAAGYLLAFAGITLQLVGVAGSSLLGSTGSVGNIFIAFLFALGILALFVGLVLLGVATLRTRMLPGWFGVLLIVGLFVVAVLVGAQLVVIGVAAYGIFWILVGYALLSSGGTRVTHSVE